MSLCECDYDLGTLEFLYEEKRRAKKAHRCSDCGGVIAPGETYFCVSLKWEGQIESFKICPGCEGLRKVFSCAGFGDLKTEIFEELHETGDLPIGDFGPLGAAKLDELLAEITAAHGEIEED
jgi:hypothetical protein